MRFECFKYPVNRLNVQHSSLKHELKRYQATLSRDPFSGGVRNRISYSTRRAGPYHLATVLHLRYCLTQKAA